MKYAVKNLKKVVKAYKLGAGSEMEKKLMNEGVIRLREDGKYELFSLEAVGGSGEIVNEGDYFKVDEREGKYFAYPNEKAWFEENHTHLSGDEYEQKTKPLEIWEAGDEKSDAIVYLTGSGRLRIDENDDDHYFNAFLWGADLSAAKDAVVLFYSVTRDDEGKVIDADFNFVARREFSQSYSYV